MTTPREKIANATLADAQAWQADPEKFLYCVDFLEISASSRTADALVDALEARFDAILGGN